jgi:tripartite-type tricarboxylate transporter receptor subunit TctC
LRTLHGQIFKVLKISEINGKLQEIGATPVRDAAIDFQKFIAEELKKWQQTVKSNQIAPREGSEP